MIKNLKLTKRKKLLGAAIICVALITGSTMLLQMGQVAEAAILDPHPGLVGWWRFDEGAGTVAEDSSGYGNDGTIYGATWVDGKYGKALSFDGVDDYVEVVDADSLDFGSADNFTLEAWAYFNSVSDKWRGILTKSVGVNDGFSFMVNPIDHRLYFYQWDANSPDYDAFRSTIPLTTDKWYHLVLIRNAGYTDYIYVNAEERGSKADQSFNYANDKPLKIGWYTTTHFFLGIIDEVRIYNRALSAAEIQDNFQKGPDFSSRLLAKVPKGTTQFMATLSWQGVGSIGVTIESPYEIYAEDMVPVYQRTSYSSDSGDMLNIKRLSISVTALSSEEEWYIVLEFDDVEDYRITVEVQG
jgi:hypothetical protein